VIVPCDSPTVVLFVEVINIPVVGNLDEYDVLINKTLNTIPTEPMELSIVMVSIIIE
jgi:hypothetical protein